MTEVTITFAIQENGGESRQINETLTVLFHCTRSWVRVENKELKISAQADNLEYAVLEYLKKRIAYNYPDWG